MLEAARIEAFEADTIEKMAPATIRGCPQPPSAENDAATFPIAVSPACNTESGTGVFTIATMTNV